jgi:hypothetical protein
MYEPVTHKHIPKLHGEKKFFVIRSKNANESKASHLSKA